MHTLILDFGCTYLRAGIKADSGKAEVIMDSAHHEHSALLPCAIFLESGKTPVAGWDASAKFREFPKSVLRQPKRFLGKKPNGSSSRLAPVFKVKEEAGQLKIESQGAEWILSDLLISLFKDAKKESEKKSGKNFSKVILAIPQGWEFRKAFLEEVLKKTGFSTVQFVSESEAVLKAYTFPEKKEGCYAVFHIGGGMFDISFFKIVQGKIELFAHEQDEALGGEDVTWKLADLCCEEISEQWGMDFKKSPEWVAKVWEEAEKAKNAVAHRGSYDIRFQDPEKGKYIKAVSRYELMNSSQDIFKKLEDFAVRALQNSGLKAEAIDEIFLSGGTTRIPYIRDLIQKVFGKKPKADLNVDQVVVIGAAL